MVVAPREEFTLPAARGEISCEFSLAVIFAAPGSLRCNRLVAPASMPAPVQDAEPSQNRDSRVYTDNVWKLLILGSTAMVLCAPALCRQAPEANKPAQDLQAGVLVAHETCVAKPEQSYALYLPSHYTPGQRWPIVYAFDPAARGNVPVELMKDAAERHGYIVVGSNNSRNGSWKGEAEAAQAMLEDTHARLSIDDGRVYFAGFSGGARVASQIAQRCKCAAGVLLNGAGFSPVAPPSRDVTFAVFAVVGSFDFNYPEVAQLDEKLEETGFPHVLRHFDGPHQWAPASLMEEGLAWFRLVAMKQSREPRDDGFVAAQTAEAAARAHALEQSGNPYAAWREYLQAAATFDGLTDTTALRLAAASLAPQKSVRDGAKREKQEFQEQDQLTGEISSGLAALRGDAVTRSDTRSQIEQKIIDLRERAAHEKRPEKVRVLRRALSGILVEAMEAGEERLDAKDINVAKDYFQLATDADPDSVWALSSLATARALTGDRKGTLEALRHAREKTKDLAAFSAWLNEEPAFTKLREDPQFRALLASP
jgi:dienelactone hydrolase